MRNLENPSWGGWGGRYVKVRENTYLDPVPVEGYLYTEGRWYGENGWGRCSLRSGSTATEEERRIYFKPMWRWSAAMQKDFAARADWCVKSYEEANHAPVAVLAQAADLQARAGDTVKLSAEGTKDPDKDNLTYSWWQYIEAGTYSGNVKIEGMQGVHASVIVPEDAKPGNTIHVICEVTDDGVPQLTRYQRVVIQVVK